MNYDPAKAPESSDSAFEALQKKLTRETEENAAVRERAVRESRRLVRTLKAITLTKHFVHAGSEVDASRAWARRWWTLSRKLEPILDSTQLRAIVLPRSAGFEIAARLFLLAREVYSLDEYLEVFADQLVQCGQPHFFRAYLGLVHTTVTASHSDVRVESASPPGLPEEPHAVFTVRAESGDETVTLDSARRVVQFMGVWEGVTERGFDVFRTLLEAKGAWVASDTLKKYQGSSERPDSIIKALPPTLKALIESKPGRGRRIAIVTTSEG